LKSPSSNAGFQLQDELTKSVVEALRIELHVEPSAPLVAEQTRDPEAYNWFMRGRSLFDWSTPHGTPRSIIYFEKAVEADPGYAMAWGYLAFARCIMIQFRPFAVAGPPSIDAMEHALALEPEQSEVLTVKAMMAQRRLNSEKNPLEGICYSRFVPPTNECITRKF